MPFTGPPWNALASDRAPRVRDRELSWPRGLYTLELAAAGDDVPQSMGGAEQFALSSEQRDFVLVCAYFAKVVKLAGQDGEFLGAVYGRFFALWPTPVSDIFAWTVAKRKERIRLDLQWASLACPHFVPPISWETFLALSKRDLRWVQDALLAHEKATRRATRALPLRMKPSTIYVHDSDDEEEAVEDEEESFDLEPLPPTAETPPRREKRKQGRGPLDDMADALARFAEVDKRRAQAARLRPRYDEDERPPAQ